MCNTSDYKTVLFTGYYFDCFSGSMMHICELGEYYRQIGYDVYIATVYITDKVEEYVRKLGLNIYVVNQLPTDIKYDIVWGYHFPILPYLINRGLKFDKVVTGCLSGFLTPMETPQEISLKYNIPIFVNSEETKTNLIKKFPQLQNRIYKLLNVVPEKFYQLKKQHLEDEVHNIAIVSNHIPEELKNIIPPFELMNIKVDCYGGIDNNPITPEILEKYDVVITIGKTVQYALVMGIPVYNYDIYGGSGYISLENIDKEEFYNFSGRSHCRKLNYDDIICEIIGYYKKIKSQTSELQKIACNRYLIPQVMENILPIINSYTSCLFDVKDSLYTIQNSLLLNEILYNRNNIQEMILTPAPTVEPIIPKKQNIFCKIFSCKNEYYEDTKHKVLTLLGIKIKFKTQA